MLWVLLAVVAHGGNALVFVVDKSLLGSKGRMSDPLRYTFYSAVLAGAGAILLLFDYVPLTMFVVGWSALAGGLYIVALWFFFTALKKGEPSRVVPIAGSVVPAFTLLLAVVFLGEVLSTQQLLAVFLLIVGGMLLSLKLLGTKGLTASVLVGTVVSGLFFAGYYAVMKHIYENTDAFLAVFAYNRVVQAVVALVLLPPVLLLVKTSRGSINRGKVNKRTGIISAVFVGNKVLAAGAFVLLNYAISLGSVTVANALQGTQYVFLLLLAAAISVWWPRLFREELSRVAVWQKVGGIGLISLGVVLLI